MNPRMQSVRRGNPASTNPNTLASRLTARIRKGKKLLASQGHVLSTWTRSERSATYCCAVCGMEALVSVDRIVPTGEALTTKCPHNSAAASRRRP